MHARTTIAAAALTTMIIAGTTRADVAGNYDGFFNPYWYQATNVPDFDQRRDGLPNDGSVHCVPTATTNWMAYIANHGAPEVAPGPGYWQSTPRYDDATLAIFLMGILMGTDSGGTGTDGGFWGTVNWLNNSTSKPFIITSMTRDLDWSPRLHTLAADGEFQGLVTPSIGWYVESGGVIERDGGHRVTMTWAEQNASFQKQLGFTDPASDDGDLDVQSAFATDVYSVTDVQRTEFVWPIWRSRVNGYKSGSKQGYIEGLTTIRPLWVLSPDPASPTFALSGQFAFMLTGSGASTSFQQAGPGFPIIDLAIHPDAYTSVFLAQGVGMPVTMWTTDVACPAPTRVEVGLTDPRCLTVGARRGVYVVDGDELVDVNLDGVDGPEERARVALGKPVDAISYDDFSHRIGLLSVADRTLTLVPDDLGIHWEVPVIPDTVALAGDGDIAWDPTSRGWFVVSDGSSTLYRLDYDGAAVTAKSFEIDGLVQPLSVSVGDGGLVFVHAESGFFELVPTVEGGYEKSTAPFFADFVPGGPVRVARSRTNYDPTLHDGPSWRHVLPDTFEGEQIAYCYPDLNRDGKVNFADLVTLLAAWGPCEADVYCDKDLDYDGSIGFGDLLVMLAAWGDCP